MNFPDKKDCLTAILAGFHFEKPRYALASRFPELIDWFIGDFDDGSAELLGLEDGILRFRLDDLYVIIDAKAIVIHSSILVNADFWQHYQAKLGKIMFSSEFYSPIILKHTLPRDGDVSDLEKSFIGKAASFIDFFDSFLEHGIPKLKFIGLVRHYVVPLDLVSWKILNKFNAGATIPGATINSKTTSNVYDLAKEKEGDFGKRFIFNMHKPDDSATGTPLASAQFDFQYMSSPPQTIVGFGGAKSVLINLSKDLDSLLGKTEFMDFEPRMED